MKRKLPEKTVWIPVLLWMAVIFGASLQNGEQSGALSGNLTAAVLSLLAKCGLSVSFDTAHFLIRKAAHFSEYAVLGALVSFAQKTAPLSGNDIPVLLLWGVCVPFADEGIQHFTSGRVSAFRDVCIDMSGFFLAVCIFMLVSKRRK